MAEYQEPERAGRKDTLESKFHEVGIHAVTAAAQYCPSLKAKRTQKMPNPQVAGSVYDTD